MKNSIRKVSIIALVISLAIFTLMLLISKFIADKKINTLINLQSDISEIISSADIDVQKYQEEYCESLSSGESAISRELSDLSDRLSYAEENLSTNTQEVKEIRSLYSVFQIKNFLILEDVKDDCNLDTVSVLYFYKTDNCIKCSDQGYVLSALRDDFPNVKVFSFPEIDKTFSQEVLEYKYGFEGDVYPALVIDGTLYKGFQSLEKLKEIVSE
ncbi:hypothetical protein KC842_00300 [Candidatus Nomurabacteria bacterium]|nr:hypothetical protein [Candidatus Nomurabacteria bacterium]USN94835.1 MAG: hypothetical protein H6791_00155 [Candidatus Nomurabacteria bacterium]